MINFCSIYICSNANEDLIHSYVEKAKSFSNINIEKIYIDENEEFDNLKESEFPDGFLYFKYLLDLEFSDLDGFVCFINFLLEQLWNINISAIASCDFENLLIKNGGYKSIEIPWIGK